MYHCRTLRHTHMRVYEGLPEWAGTSKVKPIWILLKQETVNGSGISWAVCKSSPHSRQITTPTPHPTASKHCRGIEQNSRKLPYQPWVPEAKCCVQPIANWVWSATNASDLDSLSTQLIRKTNRFNITGICLICSVLATATQHSNIPCSISRPYVNGEIFNMLSSVASDAPTLSPFLINFTSL